MGEGRREKENEEMGDGEDPGEGKEGNGRRVGEDREKEGRK